MIFEKECTVSSWGKMGKLELRSLEQSFKELVEFQLAEM